MNLSSACGGRRKGNNMANLIDLGVHQDNYINIYLRRLLLDKHLFNKNRMGYSDSRK